MSVERSPKRAPNGKIALCAKFHLTFMCSKPKISWTNFLKDQLHRTARLKLGNSSTKKINFFLIAWLFQTNVEYSQVIYIGISFQILPEF